MPIISLGSITEQNWMGAAALQIRKDQKQFVAPAIGILARGYVFRHCHAQIFTIQEDQKIVELMMVREFDQEPLGYELQQLLIDQLYQGRGIGTQALTLILNKLKQQGKWPTVEICVKKANVAAIHLY